MSTDPDLLTVVEDLRVVGRSFTHRDFVEKVQGALAYAEDWQLPGMLHGRIVRAQVPSARIVSVDTSAAEALPGVRAVLTAKDVPRNEVVDEASGLALSAVSVPVLASDRIRYQGEPLVASAAETPAIAAEAAELVAIDYEELPGVFDPEAALHRTPPRFIRKGTGWWTGASSAETSRPRCVRRMWSWRRRTALRPSTTPTSSPRQESGGSRATC
jgi:CO/xanthine dehydrogenase Mo-binding subunit